ncbi:hypothetical protein EIP91_005450 [Steccherinum ochraceum]|uniref:Uncharacterized protein n=1 Tax=Steccherinum ochraceum TaxID=92696 RepID=A0A4R0S438_9APHY|nr:hypothetical protein EIP91_005450 [Steccherinum ochraceum]
MSRNVVLHPGQQAVAAYHPEPGVMISINQAALTDTDTDNGPTTTEDIASTLHALTTTVSRLSALVTTVNHKVDALTYAVDAMQRTLSETRDTTEEVQRTLDGVAEEQEDMKMALEEVEDTTGAVQEVVGEVRDAAGESTHEAALQQIRATNKLLPPWAPLVYPELGKRKYFLPASKQDALKMTATEAQEALYWLGVQHVERDPVLAIAQFHAYLGIV